ncbi:MAG TPA: magnesium transporter CorA family protein [Gaiellaceae bacterium]
MAADDRWTDLLDPSPQELRAALPAGLHESALQQLEAPAQHADEPRPKLDSHGNYVFGVFLIPVVIPAENLVYYQEVDVIVTRDSLLTVRKTPESGRAPFESLSAQEACRAHEPIGMIVYHLIDDIAERYLDLVDGINDEIDELEDNVEAWTNEQVRQRLSDLRHDLLHIRRTLAPMRDAVRAVVDNRVDLDDAELFPHDVELAFGAAYDKFLRAFDGLELSRDLVASVRDYHVAKIANDQNEVTKRLTVIASVLLLPTFIVGLYGQNFRHIPELGWAFGYWWSWGWIVATTIAQLAFFRWKRWI